jgi:C-terminus of AA_permease
MAFSWLFVCLQLDDLISVDILLAFSMTNSCLILLRCESPLQRPRLVEKHLVALNLLCLVTGLLLSHAWNMAWGPFLAGAALLATLSVVASLALQCPKGLTFGGSVVRPAESHPHLQAVSANDGYFQTPLVPYLPCAGIFINWCLVSQLELSGLLLLLVYIGGSVGIYLYHGGGSMGSAGNSVGWKRASYESLPCLEEDPDRWPMLQRELSLAPMASKSNNNNNNNNNNHETATARSSSKPIRRENSLT